MVYSKKLLIGPLLFLTAFEFALLGLNPTFYADDSPEIITVAAALGVPHPPGYPLYMLLGRLMSLLPLPLCFSVNLLSALLGSLICLLVFFLLNKRFEVPAFISAPFAFLWMAGLSSYPSALSAKRGIYELAGVFVLAILASLLDGRLKLAAFLYGLSLGGHWMTMSVYGPGLLVLAYVESRKKPWNPRHLIKPALFFLMGLSLYLYLPLRAVNEPVVNWGYPAHWDPFLKHLTRYVDKGRDFTTDAGQWFQTLGLYLRMAFSEFFGLGLLALAGLVFEWRKNRWRALGLLLTWVGLVASISIFSKYSGKRPPLLEDYSVSSWVLVALLSGLGAWGIIGFREKWRVRATALGAVLLALSLVGVGYRVANNSQAHYTCVYDYALNSFKSLPSNALFFCAGDELQFPSWYFQFVKGVRPDLCVAGSSLSMDWNRIQLARLHPGLNVPYPRHDPSKVYDFDPFIPWMIQNNPQRRFYFTFPPSDAGLGDLVLAPLGLAQEGAPPPRKPLFEENTNDSFWAKARLRHLNPPYSSVDLRSWNTLLEDYGGKRQQLALHEMNQGVLLESSISSRKQAGEWYGKSLANLMAIQDWNPESSQNVIDRGPNYMGLGPLLHAVVFHQSVLLDIGVDYFHLGDLDQAGLWIQRASLSVPNDADHYYYAGLMSYQANNYPDSRKWLQKTLQADPSYTRANQLLQYLNR